MGSPEHRNFPDKQSPDRLAGTPVNCQLIRSRTPELLRAAAREAAWTNAELLWGVRDVPQVARLCLDVFDGQASVSGRALPVRHDAPAATMQWKRTMTRFARRRRRGAIDWREFASDLHGFAHTENGPFVDNTRVR